MHGTGKSRGPGQSSSGNIGVRAQAGVGARTPSPPCLPDHRARARQAAATPVATQPSPAQQGPTKGTLFVDLVKFQGKHEKKALPRGVPDSATQSVLRSQTWGLVPELTFFVPLDVPVKEPSGQRQGGTYSLSPQSPGKPDRRPGSASAAREAGLSTGAEMHELPGPAGTAAVSEGRPHGSRCAASAVGGAPISPRGPHSPRGFLRSCLDGGEPEKGLRPAPPHHLPQHLCFSLQWVRFLI